MSGYRPPWRRNRRRHPAPWRLLALLALDAACVTLGVTLALAVLWALFASAPGYW